MRRLLASLAALVTLIPAAAHATNNFPEIVKRETGAPDLPFCDLCHSQGITGRGTVTTPFGTYMRSRGLVANQSNSLIKALATNKAAGSDVDGDGTGDWDELSVGRDPNEADTPSPPVVVDAGSDAGRTDGGKADASTADAGEIAQDLSDGNGCSLANGSSEGAFAAGVVASAGLLARRRRSRR
jgi:hypothetical protein